MQGHEDRVRANVAYYKIVMTEAVRRALCERLALLPDLLRAQPWLLEHRDLSVAERFLRLFQSEEDRAAGEFLVFYPARLEPAKGQVLQLVHAMTAAELGVVTRQIERCVKSLPQPSALVVSAWWSYAEGALAEIIALIERGVL